MTTVSYVCSGLCRILIVGHNVDLERLVNDVDFGHVHAHALNIEVAPGIFRFKLEVDKSTVVIIVVIICHVQFDLQVAYDAIIIVGIEIAAAGKTIVSIKVTVVAEDSKGWIEGEFDNLITGIQGIRGTPWRFSQKLNIDELL